MGTLGLLVKVPLYTVETTPDILPPSLFTGGCWVDLYRYILSHIGSYALRKYTTCIRICYTSGPRPWLPSTYAIQGFTPTYIIQGFTPTYRSPLRPPGALRFPPPWYKRDCVVIRGLIPGHSLYMLSYTPGYTSASPLSGYTLPPSYGYGKGGYRGNRCMMSLFIYITQAQGPFPSQPPKSTSRGWELYGGVK